MDREFAWTSLNSLIKEKYQSKLFIVAWIHSFVEENTISSIELHTQKTWSTDCPNILGLFIQENKDDRSKPEKFDFYSLTRQGDRKLGQCKKPVKQTHDECSKKSFYKSNLDYVQFTEGSLEIVQDVYEVLLDDPMEVSFNDSSSHDITMESKESDVSSEESEVSSKESDVPLIDESDTEDEDFWKTCKGCNRTFEDSKKFCMHISHYKCKCKHSYGKELEKWITDRKASQNRKKQNKFYQTHKEDKKKYQKEYDQTHKENKKKYYQTHKEKILKRYYNLRIQDEEFAKRFMDFKNETKDGPIYVCQCCRRILFKRGNVSKI